MSERAPRTIRLEEDRWTIVRHIVEAVAIVAAGIWAFYTFIYQERIKPAGEPAALAPYVTVERLGRDRTREILRVVSHFRNAGKTEVDLAADGLNVWGDRYAARESTTTVRHSYNRGFDHSMRRTERRLIRTFGELRDAAQGGRAGVHLTVEPGTEESLVQLIVIPRGEYDSIHAQALVVAVKTPVTRRPALRLVAQTDGSTWILPDDEESDNDNDFALVP